MIYYDEIHDALESTAKSNRNNMLSANLSTQRDIANWRRRLLEFLQEIENTDITVQELIEALEDWK